MRADATGLAELEEEGVRISLTIVDTPGFGDQIDNEFTCARFPFVPVASADPNPPPPPILSRPF